MPLAANAEPALKPNQPSHRMPTPIITSGIECGGWPSLGQPFRLPSTMTAQGGDAGVDVDDVPPAKSSEPLAEPSGEAFPKAPP